MRQPGSAIKPLSYLAALGNGLQPNTLVSDDPITLPPVGGGRAREQDYWTPRNYDGGGGGIVTLRRALENSRNLATVHLLDGGIEHAPEASLDRLCKLAMEALIYRECLRYYPFVLGAQPVRPIDLAAFYAAIANEGVRPTPYVVDSIERNGLIVYRHDPKPAVTIASVDRAAFYQLKTMMQGVLARGTARSIAGLAPFVAGKTGTSDQENDAWFVGFTNDVTVAVWIGYDNAGGKRRTLGGGATGGAIAVPIFEPVMQAVWARGAEGGPCSAVGRGQASARMPFDRPRVGRSARARRQGNHRVSPHWPERPSHRRAAPAGVARERLYLRTNRAAITARERIRSAATSSARVILVITTTTGAMFRHRGIRIGRRDQIITTGSSPAPRSRSRSGPATRSQCSRDAAFRSIQSLWQPAKLLKDLIMSSLKPIALLLGLTALFADAGTEIHAQEFGIDDVARPRSWRSSRSSPEPSRSWTGRVRS